jgi:hypothetical protein
MPRRFLDVVVQDLGHDPSVTALCAGYDGGTWRADDLARHLISWVPEWALTRQQLDRFESDSWLELVTAALKNVYTSRERVNRRGEAGELLLHIALRQEFGSDCVISKIAFKDAANDTVKGFDCVHVVEVGEQLELWLGEAKFYGRMSDAIGEAISSLRAHLGRDYLRDEFGFILNKVEGGSSPHFDMLSDLLSRERPLDEIFTRIAIPVLITYDSTAASTHQERCPDYVKAVEEEARAAVDSMVKRMGVSPLPRRVSIHCIFVPLPNKQLLVDAWDGKLKSWQEAAG